MIVALEGAITMWSRAEATTCREAVPVLPESVPVTVCAPAPVAVQAAPLHEPLGTIGEARRRGDIPEGVVVNVSPLSRICL